MTLVLGVDAGGTRTRAAIADGDGRVWGAAVAAGGNLDDAGPAGAAAAIAEAVQGARMHAGLGQEIFDAVFLGIAGVVSEADRAAVLAAMEPLGLAAPGRIRIDHDCRIALAGGLSGRPGIVLIAGTGSAAFGTDAHGASWRSGGWGALIGDEGSSYGLALDALRAVVRAVDGRGPATGLREALLAELGVADPDVLMHRLHLGGWGRAEIAALAPLVVRAAEEGDAVANEVLDAGVGQLAPMVVAVRDHLRFDGPVEVACVGGLFAAGEPILARLRQALAQRRPDAQHGPNAHRSLDFRLVEPELPPAHGACLLALRCVGTVDADAVRRLGAVRPAAGLPIAPRAEA